MCIRDRGKPYDIKPGNPSSIERIESGLLSHGNDMTLDNNPCEIGLGKYCDLEQKADFIGKEALRRIKAEGVSQKIVGIVLPDVKITGMAGWRKLSDEAGAPAGQITSLAYSPRLEKTIGFAMVPMAQTAVDTKLVAHMPDGDLPAVVHEIPFIK